jgi:DNA-binding transcriptional LysR family regulator
VTGKRALVSVSACAESARIRSAYGRSSVGLLEDLAASQLPQALADLARLHPGATLEVLSTSNAAMREAYDAGRVQLVLDEILDAVVGNGDPHGL